MELTGATTLRGSPATPCATFLRGRRRSPARVSCAGRGGGFADEGHLTYYEAPPRKAVEAVARDLAKLRAMGLVAGDAAKEKVLSEATELLMEELDRMRDEEDELKKKMEEEKDAMKALKKQQKEAMKVATAMNCDEDCSSESSESECDEQIMEMSCVATATTQQFAASGIAAAPAMECDKAAIKAMKKREKEQKKAAKMAKKMKKKEMKMSTMTRCKDEDSSSESSDSECEEAVRMSRCATITTPQTQPSSTVFPIILPQIPESVTLKPCQDAEISPSPANTVQSTTSIITVVEKPTMTNRIEVCMGGKCKKSGSLAVLQEFEKNVGTEGAVVGCKCLGKCGLGPNVRVQSEGSVKKNPLFIGVGLEDVGTIVAGLSGDDDLGMVNN
ncbi:diacylglycerol O-acyltransferase 3 [Oryza brachyantha]|uniref:Uncharacterized protein n=1 Tax=Oryza brachyantha TaxID=4533 RepID=J3M3S4_ORYBR|nr:diacylglycerol O-acyltransferase 3 [Oryza brachyantha]